MWIARKTHLYRLLECTNIINSTVLQTARSLSRELQRGTRQIRDNITEKTKEIWQGKGGTDSSHVVWTDKSWARNSHIVG
jgi:hypothetical protein